MIMGDLIKQIILTLIMNKVFNMSSKFCEENNFGLGLDLLIILPKPSVQYIGEFRACPDVVIGLQFVGTYVRSLVKTCHI